ncbi:hypothetical protein [Streptomyces sp. NPDC055189]
MQRKTTTTITPRRRRVRRLAVTVAATGLLVGGGMALSTGSASAATFCGDTPAGGYACIIGQPDGSYTYYNSSGEIIYNW